MEVAKELSTRIAGEISLSSEPYRTLRKWRELFGLSLTEFAGYLGTSPSVICDYESGRRRSPGTAMVRKFVHAFIDADAKKGYPFLRNYEKSHSTMRTSDIIIDIGDFNKPLSAEELSSVLSGQIVAGEEHKKDIVYGYTLIDSIKAILELPSEDFSKLYGTTTQRALIFTKVSYGRSPLIAVRVSTIKPKIVVMHGVSEIDKLGWEIARIERIPIITTNIDLDRMQEELRRNTS